MITDEQMRQELRGLSVKSNLRSLPSLEHEGRHVRTLGSRPMLNLSSNDYLGLASDLDLRAAFLSTLTAERFLPSSSSSRLLTGNFGAFQQLEDQLVQLFGTEASLSFNSGYHANTGILPAICDAHTLILADKLVHASLIDGIRLSGARYIRYRHNDYLQIERLLHEHGKAYRQVIIVTESIFSMDGDETDLSLLVRMKRSYPNIMLYVDEAHAFGVRGERGLGCAEEQGCIADIDFLVGTFGKALASSGAYIVCRQIIRDYLINRMRTFIFSTAIAPVTVQWTSFLLQRLGDFRDKRAHLHSISRQLKSAIEHISYSCPSSSHIIPMIAGDSAKSIAYAEVLQENGFYILPVRPPTVPEGTSRLRFSLTADVTHEDIDRLIRSIQELNRAHL